MQNERDAGPQRQTVFTSSALTSQDNCSSDNRPRSDVFGGGRGSRGARRRRRRRRTTTAANAFESEQLTHRSQRKDHPVVIARNWEDAPDFIPAAQRQYDQTRGLARDEKYRNRRGKWNKVHRGGAGTNRVSNNIAADHASRESAAADDSRERDDGGSSGSQQKSGECPVISGFTRGRGRGRGRGGGGGRLAQYVAPCDGVSSGSGALDAQDLIRAVQGQQVRRRQETTKPSSDTKHGNQNRTPIGSATAIGMSSDVTSYRTRSYERRARNGNSNGDSAAPSQCPDTGVDVSWRGPQVRGSARGRGRAGRGARSRQRRQQQSVADNAGNGRESTHGTGLAAATSTVASPSFPVAQEWRQHPTGDVTSNTKHSRKNGVCGGEPRVSGNIAAHSASRNGDIAEGATCAAVRVFARERGGGAAGGQRRWDSDRDGRPEGASPASAATVSSGKFVEAQQRAKRPPANAEAEDSSDSGHRERLSVQLTQSTLDCLVCYEPIRPRDSVWSCTSCHNVLHLNCTRQWAHSSIDGYYGGWPCPACRQSVLTVPTVYRCWCGKRRDPEPSPGRVPHSCGATCGRQRRVICVHQCELTCHPGPCPPCTVRDDRPCGCGRQRTGLCGQQLSCGAVCGRLLTCGRHSCRRLCHSGPCGECLTFVSLDCLCGRCAAVCSDTTWTTPSCEWTEDYEDYRYYKTADSKSSCSIL